MAFIIPVAPKKKSSHHADHAPRDGLTGMGLETQRHFIRVRQEMTDYVDEQEAFEYDAVLQPRAHLHSRHLDRLLDRVLVDGTKAPDQRSQSSTSSSSRKHSTHSASATPQSARRERKTSSISTAK